MAGRLSLIVFVALTAIQAPAAETAKGFSVKENAILDTNGQPFEMRGISVPHSWFKDDLSVVIPAVAQTGANVVRVVLSDGSVYTRDDVDSVRRLLDLCKQHELVAMLEVHDTTGSNDMGALQRAADYWVDIQPALRGTEDRVIINIANEWGQLGSWAVGYKTVIPALRERGFTHMLAVDAAGWGQDASSIAQYGRAVFESDPLRNTIFGIHMYEVIAPNDAVAGETFAALRGAGVPFFVGEFSSEQNQKSVAYKYIMAYCRKFNIGWIVWSWYGNNDSALDLAYSADGRQLKTLGNDVVNGPDGIRRTSKKPYIW